MSESSHAVAPVVQTTSATPELPDPGAQPAVCHPLDDRELMTQELRLAVTFTGGVSLAVWMGGVAREIDRLVQASDERGRRAASAEDADTERPPASPSYCDLLELMDMAVAVDVISGTSAGGINAALLGLANSQYLNLDRLRDTWETTGALTSLLRDPRKPDLPSLLLGDGKLLVGLKEAMDIMRPENTPPSGATRPTDVFITTTLLSAESSRFVDDYGTEIVDSDHHGLFHFNERTMNHPASNAALALAARSSASFPGAFEPSFVPLGIAGDEWHPDMTLYSNTSRSHWAADGGLLANRPIAPVLQSIFDRGANREVRRTLLYVVPTSRLAPPLEPDEEAQPFGLADGLVHDLVATLNQSIAADLEVISEHNDRTKSAADTRLRMADLGGRLPPGDRLANDAAWRDYRRRQGEWLAVPLVDEITRQLAILPTKPVTWRATVGNPEEDELRTLVAGVLTAKWPTAPPELADAAAIGRPAYDSAKATLLRLLRLGFILASANADRQELARLAGAIGRALDDPGTSDLRPLVMGPLTEQSQLKPPPTLSAAVTSLAESYSARLSPDRLAGAWTAVDRICADAVPLLTRLAQTSGTVDESAQTGSLHRHRATAAAELRTYLTYLGADSWPIRLLDLHVVVRSVLPVLVEVEQPVQLIQVSADTRTRLDLGRSTAATKLTGLQFHHFGAFYKSTWRANDWMWGRLDGCGWLTHVILDPQRIITVLDNRQIGSDRPAAFIRLLEATLGGHCTVPTDVARTLDFLNDDKLSVPSSLPDLSLWVAEILQRSIAAEELTNIAGLMVNDADCKPYGQARPWLAGFKKAEAIADPVARQAAIAASLPLCPVAGETLESESGSPLFMRTLAQLIAVTTSAATTMTRPPAALRPTFAVARSITQTAYIAADQTHGGRRAMTAVGVVAVGTGALAMLDSSALLGLSGLAVFGAGALVLAMCVGKNLWRGLQALLGLAVVLIAAAPWLKYTDTHLFPWLHKTLFRWLEQTLVPRLDTGFVPWLQSHKWVWPVVVLVVLLSPLMALSSWISGVGQYRFRVVTRRRTVRREINRRQTMAATLSERDEVGAGAVHARGIAGAVVGQPATRPATSPGERQG